MKKILYIVPAFPTGGAEKFLVSLANGLLTYGHHQQVVSLSDNNPLAGELSPAVEFLSIPRKGKLSVDALKKLRDTVHRTNPDIIFCLNFFSYAFFRLALLGKSVRARVYISYHNTEQVSSREENLHKLYFGMLRRNDIVLMVSENQARYTVAHYKPRAESRYIYNGVDCDRWTLPPRDFDQAAQRSQLGLPEKGQIIILAAAFRKEKNHAGAIRALKRYHETYEDKPILLFVGDGPEAPKAKTLTKEIGLEHHVFFAGLQKDLRMYYWCSNLFTLTSTAVETFSIAALEAMACGLPAVLTNIGGASEMVIPGHHGELCSPEERDIAEAWHKALHSRVPAAQVNQFIQERFSLRLMIDAYQKELSR